ncbi:hypothetical protein OKA04_12340 [Luteolibacter flavescens]|uniref:DUF4760 domain-containing protein n=1 Tax=Luteolibacter flavescens TaxID=1859460 RepID=A0ABT3FRC9_9BACT|nr:hypothetical protein [Luteolibacter flavescens]MCW1885520.1 hypothetical protein [Luteolibacter flavescens]
MYAAVMTGWEILGEAVDWLLRAGGVAFAAVWIIQLYFKGWFTDRFATKKELRDLEHDITKIAAGATSNLRVAAVAKIIDLRFQAMSNTQILVGDYIRILGDFLAAVHTYHFLKEEASEAGRLDELEQKVLEKRSAYFEINGRYMIAGNFERAHLPFDLWISFVQVWEEGTKVYESVEDLNVMPTVDIMTEVTHRLVEFGNFVELAMRSTPDLANEIYPEKAKPTEATSSSPSAAI